MIKNRWEAWAIIYGLAVGAMTRGWIYVDQHPGAFGWALFAACSGAVFMAGAKILDATRPPAHRRGTLERVFARARLG